MGKKIFFTVIFSVIVLLCAGFLVTISSSSTSTSTPSARSQAPAQQAEKLIIKDIQEGSGVAVKSGDTVVVNYKGTLQNGKEFDNSYTRGQPFETKIGVGQVIQGWDEGIIGMKKGGKRKLTVPPSLAYGAQAQGSIPANSTLIFEVELLDIK